MSHSFVSQRAATEVMINKAKEMGVQRGVCVALVAYLLADGRLPPDFSPQFRVISLFRDPDPVGRNDPFDTGTDYFGVVSGKLGQMLRTRQDSGHPTDIIMTGELGYQGGLVWEHDGILYAVAFSGSSPENDVIIAQAAKSFLISIES